MSRVWPLGWGRASGRVNWASDLVCCIVVVRFTTETDFRGAKGDKGDKGDKLGHYGGLNHIDVSGAELHIEGRRLLRRGKGLSLFLRFRPLIAVLAIALQAMDGVVGALGH